MGSSPLQPTQPFSAPKPRSLPTYANGQDVAQLLATWKTLLDPLVQNVAPQATPLNFSATSARGGITLNWSPVSGGDGYEILKSLNGSFADDLQVIPVKNVNQNSFFDSLGGNAQKASYRIRTTSGTPANPQSQRGPESGVVSHTSIDSTDTKSVATTVFDNFTTDKTRSLSRLGNYGAVRKSQLGKTGGTTVGSGTSFRGSTPGGAPITSGVSPFSQISTGINNNATLTVSGAAEIIPDPDNPGTIDATELQGTEVSTDAPTDQEILQYSEANGVWEPVDTIDLGDDSRNITLDVLRGPQANLPNVMPLSAGEMYFASDTGNLFFGTPGVGSGYIQIADMTQVAELLQTIVTEMKAMRLALTKLACDGGGANPQDFEPEQIAASGI